MAALLADQTLTPDGLMKLFLGFPLTRIPVVHQNEIKNFLSKSKVSKLSSEVRFFDEEIFKILHHILSDESEQAFFDELDSMEDPPDALPVLNSESFLVQYLSLKEFNSTYRPIETLSHEWLGKIFEELPLPVMIFNPKRFCVFRNKRCALLKSALIGLGLGSKKTPLEECFPESFFSSLVHPDASTIYQLQQGGSAILRWKATRMEFPRGVLSVVTFLHVEGQRL